MDADCAQGESDGIALDHTAGRQHPAPRTVPTAKALLAAVFGRLALEMGVHHLAHGRDIVGMREMIPCLDTPVHFPRLIPEHGRPLRIALDMTRAQFPFPCAEIRALHNEIETAALRLMRIAFAHEIRDVVFDRQESGQPPVLAQRLDGQVDPIVATVLGAVEHFTANRVSPFHRLTHRTNCRGIGLRTLQQLPGVLSDGFGFAVSRDAHKAVIDPSDPARRVRHDHRVTRALCHHRQSFKLDTTCSNRGMLATQQPHDWFNDQQCDEQYHRNERARHHKCGLARAAQQRIAIQLQASIEPLGEWQQTIGCVLYRS